MTDHALLINIFKKDLWNISPKLQPLVERARMYLFVTSHCKGKRNKICSALLRFPVFGLSWSMIHGWTLDREETYTCEMMNANIDEDISEAPFLHVYSWR